MLFQLFNLLEIVLPGTHLKSKMRNNAQNIKKNFERFEHTRMEHIPISNTHPSSNIAQILSFNIINLDHWKTNT